MTDREFIASRYAEAGVDLVELGIRVAHFRRRDDTLGVALTLPAFLKLCQLASSDRAAHCGCERPSVDGDGCAKCGRSL